MAPRQYVTTVRAGTRGRLVVSVPFDPDEEWGAKAQHHVAGTVGWCRVRATVEADGDGWAIVLGPAWVRDSSLVAGMEVAVELEPEGPQRGDLAPDLAAALDASPAAAAFFDSLAQFYRRAYLRWIDGTRRRPDERVRRIAAVVDLCERGIKERPAASGA